ncbi:peptidoglycan/LPS O-acetylase OafA/YrhL [Pseudomonas psychrotolerans]|nr:peptidoglycan/LPS O-acetylase OafA/YrhL [Pseudomonas psychrotolerans]
MERFTALDSFRGLLAVAVVLFHTYVAQAASENPLIANAYLFVEFFFVLSGFVLMHTYETRLRSLDDYRDFTISRSARILPLHLAMLGLYILLETGRLLAEQLGISFNDPAFSGATAPEQLLPNLLLLQSWLGEAITGSFNYPSWSISIEYYLYLVFGLLVLKGQGHHRQWFLVIALLAFLQLLFPILPLKTEIFRGLSCFFAGACTYRLYVWIKTHHQGQFGGTLLEVACLIAAAAVMTSELPVAKKGVLASLVFCVTILTFAFERGLVSTVLHQGIFVRLGHVVLFDLPGPCRGDLPVQERLHRAGQAAASRPHGSGALPRRPGALHDPLHRHRQPAAGQPGGTAGTGGGLRPGLLDLQIYRASWYGPGQAPGAPETYPAVLRGQDPAAALSEPQTHSLPAGAIIVQPQYWMHP